MLFHTACSCFFCAPSCRPFFTTVHINARFVSQDFICHVNIQKRAICRTHHRSTQASSILVPNKFVKGGWKIFFGEGNKNDCFLRVHVAFANAQLKFGLVAAQPAPPSPAYTPSYLFTLSIKLPTWDLYSSPTPPNPRGRTTVPPFL